MNIVARATLLLALLICITLEPLVWGQDSRDSSSPYGVLDFPQWNHEWNNYFYDTQEKLERAATMMEEAGVRWLRMDFLWADVEPEQGHFDFERYDRIVETLTKHHIRVLGILEYNPLWRPVNWNNAPDPATYLLYVGSVVHHFKDRVKYWEVWNEPDQKTYWDPQDDLKAYSELLRAAYPVIKREDATAQVLAGAASDYIARALNSLYKQAGRDSFDIVNVHPFVDQPASANALNSLLTIYKDVRTVMGKYDDSNKPIWFTEIGSPGVGPNGPKDGWWGGVPPTEGQQAKWLEIVYRNSLQWKGVQKVFWAFFRETDHHFNNAIDTFGLVHTDFSSKPAYVAYQNIAKGASQKD
jgi:hypothetical protein